MKWISSKQAAELGKSLAAIVLAFVIGALFILVAGESPATAYSSLLKGALGTPQAVANTVSKSIPLAFTGLAVALGSRCGMLNIGAEALTESDRILLKEHSMPGKYHEADKWVLLGRF